MNELKKRIVKNGIEYVLVGDYYIPNLAIKEQPVEPIGKYGMMRRTYLKEHNPAVYSDLVLTEKLFEHLLEVDKIAKERLDNLVSKMAIQAGITEELKSRDQMAWVGAMNMIKAQAEEIVLKELVYD